MQGISPLCWAVHFCADAGPSVHPAGPRFPAGPWPCRPATVWPGEGLCALFPLCRVAVGHVSTRRPQGLPSCPQRVQAELAEVGGASFAPGPSSTPLLPPACSHSPRCGFTPSRCPVQVCTCAHAPSLLLGRSPHLLQEASSGLPHVLAIRTRGHAHCLGDVLPDTLCWVLGTLMSRTWLCP